MVKLWTCLAHLVAGIGFTANVLMCAGIAVFGGVLVKAAFGATHSPLLNLQWYPPGEAKERFERIFGCISGVFCILSGLLGLIGILTQR